MAERRVFSISRATDFLVKRSMERASLAFLPRMRSRTSLAFWADVRTYLDVARTSSMGLYLGLGGGGGGGGRPRGARGPPPLCDLLHPCGVTFGLSGGGAPPPHLRPDE